MDNEKINERIQKRFINYNKKIKSNNFIEIEKELTNRNIIFENSNEDKRKNKINTNIINTNVLIQKRPEENILKSDKYYLNRTNMDYENSLNYNFYKYQAIPKESHFPEKGINMPKMTTGYNNKILSNNTISIENNLTNRNLILTKGVKIKRKNKVQPKINNIKMLKLFESNESIYIPEPLVIEDCQRPKGPYCQR